MKLECCAGLRFLFKGSSSWMTLWHISLCLEKLTCAWKILRKSDTSTQNYGHSKVISGSDDRPRAFQIIKVSKLLLSHHLFFWKVIQNGLVPQNEDIRVGPRKADTRGDKNSLFDFIAKVDQAFRAVDSDWNRACVFRAWRDFMWTNLIECLYIWSHWIEIYICE